MTRYQRFDLGIKILGLIFTAIAAIMASAYQISINKSLMHYNRSPLVEIVYSQGMFDVHNKGKSTVSFCGIQVGDKPRDMENEGMEILPDGLSYISITDELNKRLQQAAEQGKKIVPWELFIKTDSKYIVKGRFVIQTVDNKLVGVDPQTLETLEQNW